MEPKGGDVGCSSRRAPHFAVFRDDSIEPNIRRSRLFSRELAKKHKRHPVVIPILIATRGVIPKQTVSSLAKLKAWGFDVQVSPLKKARSLHHGDFYTRAREHVCDFSYLRSRVRTNCSGSALVQHSTFHSISNFSKLAFASFLAT